jgi:hypothetical protein
LGYETGYVEVSSVVTTRAIVGSRNLLFLGAGASKPYGKLLMGEFIRSFRRKIEGGNEYPSAIPINSSPLLNAICDKHEDLEFLIEELDALSSRDYLEKETITSSNPNLPGQKGRWPDFQQIANEARRLLALLKREVYLEYRSIPDPTQTAILTKPVSLLQTDSNPTVVFTTNYDPAVEKFCAEQSLPADRRFRTRSTNTGVCLEQGRVRRTIRIPHQVAGSLQTTRVSKLAPGTQQNN